jgi:integrase
MASIRQLKSKKWIAEVRRKGFPGFSKAFLTKAEAVAWGAQVDAAIFNGSLLAKTAEDQIPTIEALLNTYLREETKKKKGKVQEANRIKEFLRHPLAQIKINRITPKDIANFRDERLKSVKPATVGHDLGVLSSFFNHCKNRWHYQITNPTIGQKPKGADVRRDRRVMCIAHPATGEPWSELRAISDATRSKQLAPFLAIAFETAMRRSEIAGVRRKHVEVKTENGLQFCVVHLPATKNDTSRHVPIQSGATAIIVKFLEGLRKPDERLFTLRPSAYSLAFRRARTQARENYLKLCAKHEQPVDPKFLVDIRLHDGRHEAISTLAERGDLSVQEIAAIAGHLNFASAQRYTNMHVMPLARKLALSSIRYPVIFKKVKNGFSVTLPDFPGISLIADTLTLAQAVARGIMLAVPPKDRPAASTEADIHKQYPKADIFFVSE